MILHDFLMNQRWRMPERYPDVSAKCTDVKFPDSRGRRGQGRELHGNLKILANAILEGSEDRPRGLWLLRGATGATDQTRKLMWHSSAEE